MLALAEGLIQIAANLRRNALRYRDRLAYVAGDTRLTWHEADRASDRLAYALRALGLGRHDRIAVFGDNGPTFILVTYAVFKLGATAVILNSALRGRHLQQQLLHAEVRAIISGRGLQGHVEAVRDGLPDALGISWDPAAHAAELVHLDAALEGDGPTKPFPIAAVDPADMACLLFSSGTTGTPKGAVNSYWNLLAKNLSLGFSQELTQSDVGLIVTPLCMGGSQLMSINPYCMLGMTAILSAPFEPGEVLRLIEAERVTTAFCVPTMINALTSHPEYATRDLSSLRKLISSGSPLPQEMYARLRARGIGVLECYGTSETGGGVMISADEKAANPRSVGRAMVGFEVRVVDEQGAAVADGEVGELVIRGDAVASGYYKQPEIEAETFRNGWFHTGDVGRRDASGFLYLTDRKKDMVKSGGINVYPKEIEEILYRIGAVIECAVVGLPHDHWGEAVTAFIIARPDAERDEAAVIAALRAELAPYQIPKAVVFVEELPKTPFGKLSKLALREQYAAFYRRATCP